MSDGGNVPPADQPSLVDALQTFSCVPLFLEPELDYQFYFGFCRSYLWPTFHNVIKSRCFTQKVWRAYCTANRKFADKVSSARSAAHAQQRTLSSARSAAGHSFFPKSAS